MVDFDVRLRNDGPRNDAQTHAGTYICYFNGARIEKCIGKMGILFYLTTHGRTEAGIPGGSGQGPMIGTHAATSSTQTSITRNNSAGRKRARRESNAPSYSQEPSVISSGEAQKPTCDTCGRKFRAKRDKVEHEKSCGRENHYKCSECPRGFNRDSSLTRHLIEKHDKGVPCEECGSFYLQDRLDRHKEQNHKNLRCDQDNCGRTFSKPCLLRQHCAHVHRLQGYECESASCSDKFGTVAELEKHYTNQYHDPPVGIPCRNKLCRHRFSTASRQHSHECRIGPRKGKDGRPGVPANVSQALQERANNFDGRMRESGDYDSDGSFVDDVEYNMEV
ncbi:hypothetical protein EDC01DRAFT_381838 [Geopyxis carbonaria]|nr:hypothetical protein EDC01DRAFT_381838 [Geopyxis carbonaria]